MDTTAPGLIFAGVMPMATPVHAEVALCTQALTRRYAPERGVFEAHLQVRRGELLALTGPSGAGKTTLLRLLAGIERPDAGAVYLQGHLRRAARRADTSVALMFQQPRLVGRATVLENVLAGRLGHVSRWRGVFKRFHARDWDLAFASLEQVGLLTRAAERADRLSGGERQRVALARALAQQPTVLLADEPVASLDPDNARRVLTLLRGCAQAGMAVIASLHQPELAREFAQRSVVMRAGQLLQNLEGNTTCVSPGN